VGFESQIPDSPLGGGNLEPNPGIPLEGESLNNNLSLLLIKYSGLTSLLPILDCKEKLFDLLFTLKDSVKK
jgi:hypothetical protein